MHDAKDQKCTHTAHTHRREEIERIYSTTKEGEICVCCCCCCYTGNHLRLLETRSLLLTRSLVKIKKGEKKQNKKTRPCRPPLLVDPRSPTVQLFIPSIHYVMIRLHPLTGIHSLLRNPILTEPLSFPPCDPSLFLLGTHTHTHTHHSQATHQELQRSSGRTN